MDALRCASMREGAGQPGWATHIGPWQLTTSPIVKIFPVFKIGCRLRGMSETNRLRRLDALFAP